MERRQRLERREDALALLCAASPYGERGLGDATGHDCPARNRVVGIHRMDENRFPLVVVVEHTHAVQELDVIRVLRRLEVERLQERVERHAGDVLDDAAG